MKFGVMVQDDELHKMLVYFSWAGIAFFFFQVLTWLISWNLFDFRSGLILQRTSKCAAAVLACTTVSRTPGWRLLPTRIALARSFRTAPRFTSWPSPRWWTTNSPLLNSNRLPNAISSPVLKPVPAGNSEEYYGENECVEVRCCRCRLTLSVYFIPHAILYTFFCRFGLLFTFRNDFLKYLSRIFSPWHFSRFLKYVKRRIEKISEQTRVLKCISVNWPNKWQNLDVNIADLVLYWIRNVFSRWTGVGVK